MSETEPQVPRRRPPAPTRHTVRIGDTAKYFEACPCPLSRSKGIPVFKLIHLRYSKVYIYGNKTLLKIKLLKSSKKYIYIYLYIRACPGALAPGAPVSLCLQHYPRRGGQRPLGRRLDLRIVRPRRHGLRPPPDPNPKASPPSHDVHPPTPERETASRLNSVQHSNEQRTGMEVDDVGSITRCSRSPAPSKHLRAGHHSCSPRLIIC